MVSSRSISIALGSQLYIPLGPALVALAKQAQCVERIDSGIVSVAPKELDRVPPNRKIVLCPQVRRNAGRVQKLTICPLLHTLGAGCNSRADKWR